MDEIEITIVNWKKYNPNSDRVRHPHWFRIHRDMALSDTLSGLSAEQCWVWVQILSECSRKNSDTVKLRIGKIAVLSKTTKDMVVQTIEILATDGGLCRTAQSTAPRQEKKREEETTTKEEIVVVAGLSLSKRGFEAWSKKYGEEWVRESIEVLAVELNAPTNESAFSTNTKNLPLEVRVNRALDARHKRGLRCVVARESLRGMQDV